MGATIPKCVLCQEFETENNPVLEVHSKGKRDGQMICSKSNVFDFTCIKTKVIQKIRKKNKSER